jgi:hypothetical protein
MMSYSQTYLKKGKNLNKGNKRPETHETDPKYRDGPQN